MKYIIAAILALAFSQFSMADDTIPVKFGSSYAVPVPDGFLQDEGSLEKLGKVMPSGVSIISVLTDNARSEQNQLMAIGSEDQIIDEEAAKTTVRKIYEASIHATSAEHAKFEDELREKIGKEVLGKKLDVKAAQKQVFLHQENLLGLTTLHTLSIGNGNEVNLVSATVFGRVGNHFFAFQKEKVFRNFSDINMAQKEAMAWYMSFLAANPI